jgi:hypothetical protein
MAASHTFDRPDLLNLREIRITQVHTKIPSLIESLYMWKRPTEKRTNMIHSDMPLQCEFSFGTEQITHRSTNTGRPVSSARNEAPPFAVKWSFPNWILEVLRLRRFVKHLKHITKLIPVLSYSDGSANIFYIIICTRTLHILFTLLVVSIALARLLRYCILPHV